MEIDKADIVGKCCCRLRAERRRLADNKNAGNVFALRQTTVLIAVGQFDPEFLTLGFNPMADREVVRIVDFQILLIAVERQNMLGAERAGLVLSGAAGFVLQLFRDLQNAMLSLFFYIQRGVIV